MKLFPKLALTVSALLLATIVGLSSAFYFAQRRSIRAQMEQDRQTVLTNLVHIAQESFLNNDDLLLVKYTSWIQKWSPALISAGVESTAGETLAHSEPSRIGKLRPAVAPPTSEVLTLSEPVRLGNHTIATATVEFSEHFYREALRERLTSLQRRLFQGACLALVVGLIISFLIALSWTRPIDSLVKAAGRIGEGKYDLDLGRTHLRSDEVGFLAKAFETMAEELRVLETMKEDFVSSVTHELRSPLGAIESYLNLIADEMKEGISDESWHLYLGRLRLNTQRLTRFVNDLLDVAALERGKVSLQIQTIHLGALAQEVVGLFAAKTLEKKISVAVEQLEALPTALLDGEKIRQVIINLFSNAMKFTPSGGRITLQVEHLSLENKIRLSVRDTGLGIAIEDQAKIFNKFEQVRNTRRGVKGPKGTGLGLSICKGLIELHGGALGVQSVVGQGATFYFTVPLVSDPTMAGLQEASKGATV